MIYVWMCRNGHETEVERKLKFIDIPPSQCSEPTCDCPTFKRIIPNNKSGVKGFILEGGGWHANEYSKYRSIK